MTLSMFCPICSYKYSRTIKCPNCHNDIYTNPLNTDTVIPNLTMLALNTYNDLHGIKMISYIDSPYQIPLEVCSMFIDTSDGDVIVNLPINVGEEGKSFNFKKISPDINKVIIITEGPPLIDGKNELYLRKQWEGITIQHDFDAWYCTSGIDRTLMLSQDVITKVQSPYNVPVYTDVVLVDTTDGDVLVNIPTNIEIRGRVLSVKKIDGPKKNIVTISTEGTSKIDGDNTLTLKNQYESVTMLFNTSDWFITARV